MDGVSRRHSRAGIRHRVVGDGVITPDDGLCVHCRQQVVLSDIGPMHVVNGRDQGWLCPPPRMTLATRAFAQVPDSVMPPPPMPTELSHPLRVQYPPLPHRQIPSDWPAPRSVQVMTRPHGPLRAAQ